MWSRKWHPIPGFCTNSWSMFFPAVLFGVFSLFCYLFMFCAFSLCCCLLLPSSMAESSLCFLICNRNSVHQLVFTPQPLPTLGSWWSQWRSCDIEITIIHVSVDGPWIGVRLTLLFILQACLFEFISLFSICFYVPLFSVLSILLSWEIFV